MKSLNLQEKYLLLKFRLNPSDPELYAQLYDFYVDKIYRFIYFKINNQDEAQDLTAEVFLKVWQYIQEKKNAKNVRALLYQSAKNIVVDYYRQKAKKQAISVEDLMQQIVDERSQADIKEIELKSEIKSLESYLQQLKAEYQEIIILKYIEGYSNKEIAKILNKSTANVRVLSHRALKVLQNLINGQDKKKTLID